MTDQRAEFVAAGNAAQPLTSEINRLRAALNDIVLLDGKRLTDSQRWDHARLLARTALDMSDAALVELYDACASEITRRDISMNSDSDEPQPVDRGGGPYL